MNPTIALRAAFKVKFGIQLRAPLNMQAQDTVMDLAGLPPILGKWTVNTPFL